MALRAYKNAPNSCFFNLLFFWRPRVVSCEHSLLGDGRCFLAGQLSAPGDTGGGVGTFAFVVVFQVACGALVVFFAPVVPSLGDDVLAEFTVHEQGVGIGAPGSAEIHFFDIGVSDESAAVEHISEFHVFWR